MPGPEQFISAALALSPFAVPESGPLLGYGPAPGVELIPYFLGLLAWAGLALSAIFLSPLLALFRRLRRAWGAPRAKPKSEQPPTARESPGAGSHDRA